MKWIIRIVVALVAVVIIAALVVFFLINTLAKSGIKHGATFATGTPTTLEGVSIGIFSGSAELDGLKLANPEGYGTENFFALGQGEAAVSLGSLMGEKVEVPYIRLDNVHLSVEAAGPTKINIKQILDHVKSVSGGGGDSGDTAEGKRFVVKELTITNIKMTGALQLIPGQDPINVDTVVPDIKLNDIGSDTDKGVVMSELSRIVLEAILTNAINVLAQVGDLGVDVLKGVGDKAGESLEKIGGEAGKLLEGLGGNKDGAEGEKKNPLEGLGNLLGGDKEKEEAKE